MKTFLFLFLVSSLCFTVSAQKFCLKQSDKIDRTAKLQMKQFSDNLSTNPSADLPDFKPVSNKSLEKAGTFETVIGTTVYDLQTNGAVGNRIYAYPDGTKAAVWTMGFTPTSYPDRGTGYNYFDGVSWGDEPSSRIESVRTGWPSYCPLGEGELIVAHDFVSGLQLSKRPVKGVGNWTTSFLAAPEGAIKVSWPRVIVSGNTIHILAVSGVPFEGLDLALLYYRSTDGGITWENPRVLPGLDAASLGAGPGKSFTGFGGDAYAWAEPKHDTIAFAIANQMGGAWIMKSFDNGVNWSKVTIFTMPILSTAPSPIMASTDGSISLAMDREGTAHVVFGRMFVSDDDFNTAGYNYYPYTDGLIYWNENMPQLDTTQLADAEMLMDQGNLIGWMKDINGSAEIDFPEVASGQFPFGLYGSSLSSMGQISIDNEDKIYVTFSTCREDLINSGAHPNVQLYRHLYHTSKNKMDYNWSDPVDLNDDIEHTYDEIVFASLAEEIHAGFSSFLNILCQIDPEPGIALGADEDEPGENYIYFLSIPYFGPSVKPAGVSVEIMVSPNPANEFTNIQLRLEKSDRVEISVYDSMGKMAMCDNHGNQLAGYHTYQVNTSNLPSGIYFFSIKIGDIQTSKKVVVE